MKQRQRAECENGEVKAKNVVYVVLYSIVLS